LALLLITGFARAQEVRHPGADKVPELFAQALPHLEAVLGAPLERPPQFRVVTPDQFWPLPDPDLDAALRWHFPELTDDAFRRALDATRYVAAGVTVARHAEGSDVIHVLPDNLTAIARWDASLAQVDSPGFLQLALVHATVRMVLDRRYDLAARRKACRDGEEWQALQAVFEGRALWLTARVARRLGSAVYLPLLAQRYLRVPDVAADPALRTISQTALRQRYWACANGLAFFNYLDEKGLKDAEKRAFARPPRQVRWIERPELYVRAEEGNRPDLAAALRSLQESLPAAEWSEAQQPWTPAMLRQVAALLGEGVRAERVIGTWNEGRSVVWAHRKDSSRQVAVSVVRHETPAGARAYFGFAMDLQRKQDQLSGTCGPAIRVLESKATGINLPGVDEAVRNDKRVQYGAGSGPVSVSTVLARAGDVVIECSWHGLPVESAWAERVIAAALSAAK